MGYKFNAVKACLTDPPEEWLPGRNPREYFASQHQFVNRLGIQPNKENESLQIHSQTDLQIGR